MVGRKNVINLLIVVVALIFIVGIALRFYIAEERTLNFSGPNVYRATYVYDAMQKQGFSVDLKFSGRWTDSDEKVESEGLIVDTDLGSFTIILDGREVTVGGPFSSTEDIQAASLSLVPAHAVVIKIGIESQEFSDLKSLNSFLENFVNRIISPSNIYEIGIKGDITLDVSETIKPTIIQDLHNVLRPQNEFVLFERGLIIKLEDANVDELKEVAGLFENKGIKLEKVATSRLELFLRAKEKPLETREALQKRAEDYWAKIFLFKIIAKPVP